MTRGEGQHHFRGISFFFSFKGNCAMLPNPNENLWKLIFKCDCFKIAFFASASFSGWHQQIHISELMTFDTKGTTCSPKKLSSHTLGSFCQEPKVSGIPYAFRNVAGSHTWHTWGCFWQADAYPMYNSFWPQEPVLIKVTLWGSWVVTQEITVSAFTALQL